MRNNCFDGGSVTSHVVIKVTIMNLMDLDLWAQHFLTRLLDDQSHLPHDFITPSTFTFIAVVA